MTNLALATKLRAVHERAAAEFELAIQRPASLSAATMSTIIGRLMGELTCAAIEAEYIDRNVSRPAPLAREAA